MSSFDTDNLNQSIDVTREFKKTDNTFFLGAKVDCFDSSGRSGLLRWKRFAKKPRFAFNQGDTRFEPAQSWTFPRRSDILADRRCLSARFRSACRAADGGSIRPRSVLAAGELDRLPDRIGL